MMERTGIIAYVLDDSASVSGSTDGNEAAAQSPAEARRLSIQRCIQALEHASRCRDANCRLSSCQKMKRVMAHTRSCRRKTSGGCPVCKQLIALCCYHAKHCIETRCTAPFCVPVKRKLQQQQQQQRLLTTSVEVQRETAILSGTTSNATDDVQSTDGPLQLEGDAVVQVPDDVSTGQIQQSATTVAEQVTVVRQPPPPPPSVMLPAGTETI